MLRFLLRKIRKVSLYRIPDSFAQAYQWEFDRQRGLPAPKAVEYRYIEPINSILRVYRWILQHIPCQGSHKA